MDDNLSYRDKGCSHAHNPSDCAAHPFHCPEFLPASVPDDLFCSPLDCPERIPTPRFSSPNSPLPLEELEQLKACIEEVNELLRTLGNPRDPANLTALRLHFRRLRGILVRVEVACDKGMIQPTGCLVEAGRDFLQLDTVGEIIFVPFGRICSVHRAATGEHDAGHGQELIDIDACLRRALVLNFSKVVAGNPRLINIFFGIQLHLQLLCFLGYEAFIKTRDDTELIQGTLVGSEKNYLQLQTDKQIKQINFRDVCYVKI